MLTNADKYIIRNYAFVDVSSISHTPALYDAKLASLVLAILISTRGTGTLDKGLVQWVEGSIAMLLLVRRTYCIAGVVSCALDLRRKIMFCRHHYLLEHPIGYHAKDQQTK